MFDHLAHTTKAGQWLRRHREDLIDLALLASVSHVAARLTGGAALPPVALGLVLATAALIPRPAEKPGTAGTGHGLLSHLLRQLSVAAVAAGIIRLGYGLPWSSLVFLPIWIAASAAVRLWLARSAILARWEFVRRVLEWIQKRFAAGDDTALAGAAVVAAVEWLAAALNPNLDLTAIALAVPPLLWIGLDRLPWQRWQEAAAKSACLGAFVVRATVWAASLAGLAAFTLPGGCSRAVLAWIVAGGASLAVYAFAHGRRATGGMENLRRLGVAAFALWLLHPYASPRIIGGGDAGWYAATLADVLAQSRAGIWPVFVGQSEFQFNGSIFPVRVAPLFHHLGVLIDIFTLRTLDPPAVQNLLLIAVGLAGAFVCYATLGALLPARRWLAASLSGLYLACPGVLATAYGTDLYMTWMTVPWLPLALWGSVRSFREAGFRPLLPLVAGVALLWWGHSPIALWTTLLVGAAQLARLVLVRRNAGEWLAAAGAAGLFLLLTGYPFVSVLVVTPEKDGSNLEYTVTRPDAIVGFVKEAFPAAIRPLKPAARPFELFQLGWSLWLGAAYALILTARLRRKEALWLSGSALLLLLLLTPVPGVNALLWKAVPGFIRDPTGIWAMNRLYLIAAALIVFAVAAVAPEPGKTGRTGRWLTWLAVLGLGWNAWEAARLMARAVASDRLGLVQPSRLRSENLVLTRYSYLVFGRPPSYFSHGVVDPALEQRLFARDSQTLVTGNLEVLSAMAPPAGARGLAQGELLGERESDSATWRINPHFRVEPDRRYALVFDSIHAQAAGVLVIDGLTLHRVYQLPSYGGENAFGAGPEANRALSLFTSGQEPMEIALTFIATGEPPGPALSAFGHYRWIEYDPAALPVHVTSWMPYEARVRAPAPGWLETPRMFQRGYAAEVNGRPAAVAKSKQGLVMIEVPAGESAATLAYHAPFALRASYWISLATLAGLIVAACAPSSTMRAAHDSRDGTSGKSCAERQRHLPN